MTIAQLRLTTQYSITQGVIALSAERHTDAGEKKVYSPLEETLSAWNTPAAAVTDHMNVFGAHRFYKALKGKVTPIIGCELSIEDGDSSFRVPVYCENDQGWQTLSRLLTGAWDFRRDISNANPFQNPASVPLQSLLSDNTGLRVLSGGQWGDVGQALLQQDMKKAAYLLARWKEAFDDRYFLEVHRFADRAAWMHTSLAAQLSEDSGTPLIATHPAWWLTPEDRFAHEARVAIADGKPLGSINKRWFPADGHVWSPAEYQSHFSDLPEALANANAFAADCHIKMGGDYVLPRFDTGNVSEGDFMTQTARDGLKRRLDVMFPDPAVREEKRPQYEERLEFECNRIVTMNFAGYFLIVADFIRWAKQNNVPVGPGRGSGAGSLAAFCLDITDIDPIPYDLLFERFLNPERVSMPDFDIDFCQEGRDKVIRYVREKYGEDSVSQIATFGTIAARMSVRDAARALGYPMFIGNELARLIPGRPGTTLADALEQEPALLPLLEKNEDYARVFELAQSLEGTIRSIGMHAGGVLIAPGKIESYCPLYRNASDAVRISQFDKDDVEKIGLVKFDFLGLRTLTVLDKAVALLHETGDLPKDFDFLTLPMDDTETFRLLQEADTTAVFQLESHGMKELVRNLSPDCFEDMISLVALFRPGPLQSGMVTDFIDRKQGRSPASAPHPSLEPVLGQTYGTMIYQEQVMQTSQVMAGYTLGGADLLRRAMGKKKPEEMAAQRKIFTEGAQRNGHSAEFATDIFDMMEKFAEYGFNKSHSAAYALVSYRTAWVKAHFRAALTAAAMTVERGDSDRIRDLVADARKGGLTVLSPDINRSVGDFKPIGKQHIDFGLRAIKWVGESQVEAIIQERTANGQFSTLENFIQRLGKRINKRTLEMLAKSGAFDSLEGMTIGKRGAVAACASNYILRRAPNAIKQNKQGEWVYKTGLTELNPHWQDSRFDQLSMEKQAFGFYFSGHPFELFLDTARETDAIPVGRLEETTNVTRLIACIPEFDRVIRTSKGDPMAFLMVDDSEGRKETTVFPTGMKKYATILRTGQPVFMEIRVEKTNEGVRSNVECVYEWEDGLKRFRHPSGQKKERWPAPKPRLFAEGEENILKPKNDKDVNITSVTEASPDMDGPSW